MVTGSNRTEGPVKVFCKGQDSMLGSVGYRVSITSMQFCHCCESNHRHYIDQRTWLYSEKSLGKTL